MKKRLIMEPQHKTLHEFIAANDTLMDRLALTEVDSKDTD
jgi:hypothetical protein